MIYQQSFVFLQEKIELCSLEHDDEFGDVESATSHLYIVLRGDWTEKGKLVEKKIEKRGNSDIRRNSRTSQPT